MASRHEFPKDTLVYTVTFLDSFRDLISLSLVCKRFHTCLLSPTNSNRDKLEDLFKKKLITIQTNHNPHNAHWFISERYASGSCMQVSASRYHLMERHDLSLREHLWEKSGALQGTIITFDIFKMDKIATHFNIRGNTTNIVLDQAQVEEFFTVFWKGLPRYDKLDSMDYDRIKIHQDGKSPSNEFLRLRRLATFHHGKLIWEDTWSSSGISTCQTRWHVEGVDRLQTVFDHAGKSREINFWKTSGDRVPVEIRELHIINGNVDGQGVTRFRNGLKHGKSTFKRTGEQEKETWNWLGKIVQSEKEFLEKQAQDQESKPEENNQNNNNQEKSTSAPHCGLS